MSKELNAQYGELIKLIREQSTKANETALLRAENRLQEWRSLHSRGLCAAHKNKFMTTTSERLCSQKMFNDKISCLLITLIDSKEHYFPSSQFYGTDCLERFEQDSLIQLAKTLDVEFNYDHIYALREASQTIFDLTSDQEVLSFAVKSEKVKPVFKERFPSNSWFDRVMRATRSLPNLEADFDVEDDRLVDKRSVQTYSYPYRKAFEMLEALNHEDLEPLQKSLLSERVLILKDRQHRNKSTSRFSTSNYSLSNSALSS